MAREKTTKEKSKRQVVLVIVEGQSDENALSVALTELLELKYGEEVIVRFAKMHQNDGTVGGDITSANGVVPEKIQMVMNITTLMPCIKSNDLMPKHVAEVIQIIDTDGAFIPDSSITFQSNEDSKQRHIYCTSGIRTEDVTGISRRNARKRDNILALLELHDTGVSIQNYYDTGFGNKPTTKAVVVPYYLYYFSCNIDHFICNDANLEYYKKCREADSFGRRHGNDLASFVAYLENDECGAVDLPYEQSWEYIQQDLNSVNRHTNINLLVSDLHNTSL